MALTHKQEKFAQLVASGKSQADAYRGAYNSENSTNDTIYVKASELMADGNISGRVKELRDMAAVEVKVTLEEHLSELKELRNRAKQLDDLTPAIKAEELRGKACGLYVNKTEVSGTLDVTILRDQILNSPNSKINLD